jgi:hypothetical protein
MVFLALLNKLKAKVSENLETEFLDTEYFHIFEKNRRGAENTEEEKGEIITIEL